ncbi:hypothetical protein ILYODFUR_030413 [Ilyodon furcidens]|uniref:Uncharacterized protein n=1 Tax=Ilyodon furcidens TaxID=33524 RepID=A0ABV0UDP6_9TELE
MKLEHCITLLKMLMRSVADLLDVKGLCFKMPRREAFQCAEGVIGFSLFIGFRMCFCCHIYKVLHIDYGRKYADSLNTVLFLSASQHCDHFIIVYVQAVVLDFDQKRDKTLKIYYFS